MKTFRRTPSHRPPPLASHAVILFRWLVLVAAGGVCTAASAQGLACLPPAHDFSESVSLNDDIRVRPTPERHGMFIATYGPYTHHTGKGPYNSHPAYRGLEWESPERWTVGGADFKNSFSQPCWYAFAGKRFILKHHSGRFFAKVTGGVIYGYKPPHADAVPINWCGYSPAIIPSLGYHYKNVSVQLVVFGRAYGAMPMISGDLR